MNHAFSMMILSPSLSLVAKSIAMNKIKKKIVFMNPGKNPTDFELRLKSVLKSSFPSCKEEIPENESSSDGAHKIFLIARNASSKLSMRKKIHAKETSANVTRILSSGGRRNRLRTGAKSLCAHWKTPCKSPQNTKFRCAPCQTPLTKNTTRRFR